ncbi:uncharacterized protein G2W53_033067 [Senna tora]|uniref:Uncharacterized protein n=1 Tax=Senna tora TaxID=362788 RepID=A0A834WAP9_9FABA|nr:uncharacterized protein G2W53_033067 [Senna tora]
MATVISSATEGGLSKEETDQMETSSKKVKYRERVARRLSIGNE